MRASNAMATGGEGNTLAGVGPGIESMLRAATAGIWAGAIAGVLTGGVLGRLAMRVAGIMATDREQGSLTDAEEAVGTVTLDGTIGLILFIGIVLGMAGGLLYAITERWLRDAGRWRGLLFGALLVATLGWAFISYENPDFATIGSVTVNIAMFTGIYLAFGALVAPLYTLLQRVLPSASASLGGVVAVALYALAAVFAFSAVLGIGFMNDGENLVHGLVAWYMAIVLPLAAWAITTRSGGFDRLSDLRHDRRLYAAAIAAIALPVAGGLILNANSLARIFSDAYG